MVRGCISWWTSWVVHWAFNHYRTYLLSLPYDFLFFVLSNSITMCRCWHVDNSLLQTDYGQHFQAQSSMAICTTGSPLPLRRTAPTSNGTCSLFIFPIEQMLQPPHGQQPTALLNFEAQWWPVAHALVLPCGDPGQCPLYIVYLLYYTYMLSALTGPI